MVPKEIEEKLLQRFLLFKVEMSDCDFGYDQAYTVKKICTNPEIVEQHAAQIIESQNALFLRSIADISFANVGAKVWIIYCHEE